MAADDRIDGYAAAILQIAKAEGELERVGDELFRIARSLESSPELREALTDRRLGVDRKLGIVEDLLGDKVSSLSMGLVSFVVSVDRASDLPAIADRLAEQAAGERNHAIAEVRTAVELTGDEMARLTEALNKATGKQVEVKTVIDPSIIGGVFARVGDTVIDGSVRHRLDEVRQQLTR
ncbi:ATP synthase F1 subunit delta [bacterium]|nr:ATP synthase F1 subunit delta [bacterium]